MGTPQSSSSRSTLAIVSLFVGCAACCALPLLATLGVAGAGAGIVSWLVGKPILVAVAISMAVFGLGFAWQTAIRRRSKEAATHNCTTSCAVDQACCTPAERVDR